MHAQERRWMTQAHVRRRGGTQPAQSRGDAYERAGGDKSGRCERTQTTRQRWKVSLRDTPPQCLRVCDFCRGANARLAGAERRPIATRRLTMPRLPIQRVVIAKHHSGRPFKEITYDAITSTCLQVRNCKCRTVSMSPAADCSACGWPVCGARALRPVF